MKKELREIIIRMYGSQCEEHIDEIESRISKSIAALLFAGDQGNSPLCILNRAFKKLD